MPCLATYAEVSKSFIHTKGQQWYGRARVWQEETLEAYVSACWEDSYEEA